MLSAAFVFLCAFIFFISHHSHHINSVGSLPHFDLARASVADDVKGLWIAGEDATFVLQHDLNATFFFVEDNPGKGIDPVRSFLLRAELNVRQLFHHLLFRPNCVEREAQDPYGASCAPPSTGRQQIVVDVGCNRGWYSFMAASYGHTVYAFDPQPHCHSLLTATVRLNGFHQLVHFTNAFVTDIPNFSMDIKKRTGCMGGFPNNNFNGYADRFRKPLEALAGANQTVHIGSVALDDMFHPDTHDILLLKMDVEGHESHAINSATRLLSKNAVRNILVEFNLPMMGRQPEGIKKMKRMSLELVKKLMEEYRYKVKASHKGHWTKQAEMSLLAWEELFTESRDAFVTIDAWFYK